MNINQSQDQAHGLFATLQEQAISRFMEQYPGYRFPERLSGYWTRYINSIRHQVIRQIQYKRGLSFNFHIQKARYSCSVMTIDGRKVSVWTVFNQIMPIVVVIESGNNMTGEVSKVTMEDRYIDMLISTSDAHEIVVGWFSECEADSEVKYITINRDSLNHYIMATEQDLAAATDSNYIERLVRNLRHARQVMVVADNLVETGETAEHSWPHIAKSSPYGRNYYTGLSLHNCHRELRRAAIGNHYQYDLNAAVYAIKLTLVSHIYDEYGISLHGEFVNTKEYLDYKSAIRRRLAKLITSHPNPVKIVKSAITAVGFGARLHNSSWTDAQGQHWGSLTEIIKNPDDRARFINDPWVKTFVKEQQRMSEIIAEYWIRDPQMSQQMRLVPNMLTPSGKFRNNQVVCYMFQQMEANIIRHVFHDQPVLVDIHDAVISLVPLNEFEIKSRLAEISPWLHMDKEYIGGYYREINDSELVAHVNRIEAEERRVAVALNRATHYPTVRRVSIPKSQGECWLGEYKSSNYDRELDPFLD